jgi:predicted glycosyl hydrolase (DUF1957 family)
MKWINFIHFYQPANLEDWKILEAYEKSYKRLIKSLQDNPLEIMTANFSGSLLERLFDLGKQDFLSDVAKLIETGRLEIVGTAAYHALLPLVDKKEAIYQIKKQEEYLAKYLGVKERPAGFFLPEMAGDKKTFRLIKKLGYQYVILDPISAIFEVDSSRAYLDKDSGLKIVFRNRSASRAYAPDYILDNKFSGEFLVTGADAELYGLRHEDFSQRLEIVLRRNNIQNISLSNFLSKQKKIEKISLRAASWESELEDIVKNEPFSLWLKKNNRLHKLLWKLADLATELSQKKDIDNSYVHWHLSRGLASCTFWWASGYDFSKNFGPIAWSPDEVERGLNDLIRSVRSLPDKYRRHKIRAEKIRVEITKELWLRHWRQSK